MNHEHETPRRFQFGLGTLLLVPLIVAVLCSTYLWAGFDGVVVVAVGSGLVLSYLPRFQVRESWYGPREILRIVAFIGIVLTLWDVLLPKIGSRGVNHKARCQFKLQQIGIALRNYHAEYGCFPSAYITDETGRPMHSWRVLLLPYLDRGDLYNEYNFSEPWDGPNNSQFSTLYVDEYTCWIDDPQGPIRTTSYLAVVGDRSLWPGSRSMSVPAIGNKPGEKILIVEVANSGIQWFEPRDLSLDQMEFQINSTTGPSIRSQHPGGANVAFADGTVRFLERRDQRDLKKLLRIDNGRVTKP